MSLDELVEQIDKTVNQEVESLLGKLGYNYQENMSIEEYQALQEILQSHKMFLDIKTRQKKKKYTVKIRLTKLLTFTL